MIDSKEDNINEDEYEKEIREESKRLANEVFLDLKKYEDIRLSNGGPERLVGICIDKGYKFPLNQCFKAYCVLQDLSTQYCKEKVHTFAPEIFL